MFNLNILSPGQFVEHVRYMLKIAASLLDNANGMICSWLRMEIPVIKGFLIRKLHNYYKVALIHHLTFSNKKIITEIFCTLYLRPCCNRQSAGGAWDLLCGVASWFRSHNHTKLPGNAGLFTALIESNQTSYRRERCWNNTRCWYFRLFGFVGNA